MRLDAEDETATLVPDSPEAEQPKATAVAEERPDGQETDVSERLPAPVGESPEEG